VQKLYADPYDMFGDLTRRHSPLHAGCCQQMAAALSSPEQALLEFSKQYKLQNDGTGMFFLLEKKECHNFTVQCWIRPIC